MSQSPSYHHTQKSPLCLIIYGFAFVSFAAAFFAPKNDGYLLLSLGGLHLVLGPAFHYFTVTDQDDRLAIRFGPLPLFTTSIPYNEITDVAVDRTTIFEGWGIHKSTRRGWVYNIWGRDCVVVRHGTKTSRIGTDEPHRLAEFLQSKIG